MPVSTIFQLYRGSFIGGGRCKSQTLSHNVVSSTPRLSGIRTLNIGGDRHWLHR